MKKVMMLTSQRSLNIVQHGGLYVFPFCLILIQRFQRGILLFSLSLSNAFTKDYWREPCMIIMIGVTIRRCQETARGHTKLNRVSLKNSQLSKAGTLFLFFYIVQKHGFGKDREEKYVKACYENMKISSS